jgi:predicted lipoprotein with Yx(FWY)xxD motif
MKSNQSTLLLGLFISIGMVGVAFAADLMTNKDGMTVYTFDKDTAGKSACMDACLAKWPAVAPGAMKGSVDTITRDDGSKQAAVKGKALYLFAGDKKAGDATGDGMGGVWHVVK